MKEPNRSEAEPYSSAGYQLIPLYCPADTSEHKGKIRKDGKRPLHGNWTKRKYRNADVLDMMDAGHNVGVRLKASQLVIDVDPRNMPEGRDTFVELCEEIGLDPDQYPVVRTGSGGLHVYMKKPETIKMVDSLEDFPGVEFKSEGRQVVSAGSVHPDTGKLYEFDFTLGELGHELDAPQSLIVLARRPDINKTNQAGGGEYDQEEVAIMLDALDPTDFKDQDDWLTLMQSVHHASGGDAREEFIEWSTRDPEYADDGWIIGRRWDSLHVQREGGIVTYRTLHKIMRDAGVEAEGAIIRPDDPDDDFGDEDIDFEVPHGRESNEKRTPLDKMNDEYIVVNDGGKVVVMGHEINPNTGRLFWNRWSRTDFNFYLANKTVLVPKGDEVQAVPITEEWYKWKKRRTAKGVIFDPENTYEGYLNLWQGWAYQPKRGNWDLLKDLILNTLCDGDEEAYEYVYRWMANMIQRPGSPAEVAIAFHGAKGTGKSTLGNILCRLAGSHGLAISSANHLTGRFNAHLEDCLMLFADEAIKPHDRASESLLKTLITEEWMAIEGKGVNLKTAKNHIHLMLASNDEWFLPASFGDGERRFFVSKVSNNRKGDKKFFKDLHHQMDTGGYEAMLYELSTFDLGEWHPRDNIPQTQALAEQQMMNMSPIQQWWFQLLNSGEIDMVDGAPMEIMAQEGLLPDWREGWIEIEKNQLRQSFTLYAKSMGVNPYSSGRALDAMFTRELHKICPSIQAENNRRFKPPSYVETFDMKLSSDGRARTFGIPPLGLARQEFAAILGFDYDWGEQIDMSKFTEDEDDFG